MIINDIDTKTGKVIPFNATDAALTELRSTYGDISAIDADTDDGYAFLRDGIKVLTKYRTGLDAKRKELKDPLLEAGRTLDAEAKRITAELKALEDPMKAKKQEKDEREKRKKEERIARLQKKVDSLKAYADNARGKSSDEIAALIEELDAIDTENDFYDLTTEACTAKRETLDTLSELYTDRLSYERAEDERIEQERINAELRAKQERSSKLSAIESTPLEFMGKSASEIRQKRNTLKAQAAEEQDAEFRTAMEAATGFLTQMLTQAEQLEAMQPAPEPKEDDQPEAAELADPFHPPLDPDDVVIDEAPVKGHPAFGHSMTDVAADDTVNIPRREYEQLLADQRKLKALEAAGVDNWPGYAAAVKAA